MNAPAEPTSLAPGRRLGRYEICAELAAGGMGTVYLARATGPLGFDKLVALKVVHPHLARERAFIHMFLDEARIASRITHANVGSVFDVGEDSGTFYLAMDYLHGESLASVLGCVARTPASRVSPLYPVIVTAIVAAACEGLHAAHELRADGEPLHVVHRDVSPHNIFVTYDGGVRVVDFGIARAAGRLHKTLSGTVRGKVAYMPPEQLRGDPLDRRADIWAIGVTLWELLTCRRLFRREAEGKTIDAVLTSFIPAASTYAPYLPPELDDIIGETLSRDPNGRPDSARALGKRLRRAIAGTGEVVGTAELAEWMEQLFADHRVDKQRMIDEARKGGVVHNVPDTERFARIPADLVPTMVEERSDVRATAAAREGMQTLRDGGMGASRAAAGGEMEAGSETQTETKTGAETGAETGSETQAETGSEAQTESGLPRGSLRGNPVPKLTPHVTEPVVLPVHRKSRVFLVVVGVLGLAAVAVALVVLFPQSPPPTPVPLAPEEPPVETPSSEPLAQPDETPRDTTMAASTDAHAPIAPPDRPHPEKRPGSYRLEMGAPEKAPPAPDTADTADTTPGRLSIGVRGGWGSFVVDGTHRGDTPSELTLAPGRHRVAIRPFGDGEPILRTVLVRPDQLTRLTVDAP